MIHFWCHRREDSVIEVTWWTEGVSRIMKGWFFWKKFSLKYILASFFSSFILIQSCFQLHGTNVKNNIITLISYRSNILDLSYHYLNFTLFSKISCQLLNIENVLHMSQFCEAHFYVSLKHEKRNKRMVLRNGTKWNERESNKKLFSRGCLKVTGLCFISDSRMIVRRRIFLNIFLKSKYHSKFQKLLKNSWVQKLVT